MTLDQLPGRVREFANHLDGLLARLDQGAGWCAVFWQRDPDGMRACLDGSEIPPWDVVEALLQDLATEYGVAVAASETDRARALHAAALVAHDARPGGRDALRDRFDVMLREQRYAAERQAELGHFLARAATQQEADAIRIDLAWARDDHERATRRCAELRSRIEDLDRRSVGGGTGAIRRGGREAYGTSPSGGRDQYGAPTGRREANAAPSDGRGFEEPYGTGFPGMPRQREDRQAGPAEYAPRPEAREPEPEQTAPAEREQREQDEQPAPAAKQRKRRRGSARFAGMVEEEAAAPAPVVVPPTAVPDLPAAPVATGRSPRGARFAGAAEVGALPEPRREALDTATRREAAETVGRLVRLRGEGRSGEAHALLAELASWPAVRYPLLAAEMQRAGLGADWATLLWETASLPPDRLVAAADALAAAGRVGEGEQVLRQGVVRPAGEIGQAVVGLAAEGRRREARALLDAYVRVRTAEEAAHSVEPDPGTLVPLLMEAAQGVSEQCRWDLTHALRVAGHTA